MNISSDLWLAPLEMIRELRRKGGWGIRLWGAALNIPQAIGGIVFIFHMEGFLVLIFWALSMVLAGRIYRLKGLSPWISLCHVGWFALLPLLWSAIFSPSASLFYYWLLYTFTTIIISLILDTREISRALSGGNEPNWAQ